MHTNFSTLRFLALLTILLLLPVAALAQDARASLANLPDADVLGQCLTEALDELLDTASGTRPKVPRGRRKPSKKS